MLCKKTNLLLLAVLFSACLAAQTSDKDITQKEWKAFWIAAPNTPANDYGVYHFRKTVTLPAKPSRFIVHVSADNRYKLYVNGTLVSLGPARGDMAYWNYETVDLAPFLKEGNNIVAAVVWNDGAYKPEAQISYRTAFILQGDTPTEEVLNTNQSWQSIRDSAYQPLPPQLVYSYYVSGPGELVDMRQTNCNWMTAGNMEMAGWSPAQQLFNGLPKGVFAFSTGWMLVPRPIPQMELTVQRLGALRRSDGLTVPEGFPAQKKAVTIPAHTTATLLLDQSYLTNAYPTLLFSKGKNATLSLQYAEALYVDEGDKTNWRAQTQKGNRDEIAGKRFVGKKDSIISNGSDGQQFTPLWFRTYRYMQLKVQTEDDPLVIDDLYGTFTGYPFRYTAAFRSGDSTLSKIIQVGWHTARLCAVETYMDCPYYEQLQYAGDTRIQALVSLYNSGDDRLMRNAINLLDHSRMAEGITLSRYPTANSQQIPPFSLWWIGMLHDYWTYRPDAEFVRQKLPGARQVLLFFSRYQQGDGSLVNAPYWNFTDWSEGKGWSNGVAPVGKDGHSAALDLQLLWAYQLAAELEKQLGMAAYAVQYNRAADLLKATIRSKYWNAAKGLFADTPEKEMYSQHVNALAILTGIITGKDATALAQKILNDTSLTKATIYFKYYIHQALIQAGLGNDYLNWLDIWRQNLAQGMTTWAEMSDINRSRSDCHAWGSHPNIEFFRTVLGIDSDAPGFSKIKIEPHLGRLQDVSGDMPHPAGTLSVAYKTSNGKTTATITLPAHIPGYLLWKGKRYELKAGQKNVLQL